jgi:hypothetical protein
MRPGADGWRKQLPLRCDRGYTQERPCRNARIAQKRGSALVANPTPGPPRTPFPCLMARFLVEVSRSTIEAFVRFGFIRPNQQNDLVAIMGALRLLGRVPAVSHIA